MSLWGQYEERVRLGCERFLVAARRNGFTGEVEKRLAKEWALGMRAWIEAHGENWELLDRAVDYMRQQEPPLIIGTPRSCIKVAREFKDWQASGETEAGRQAYADALREAQGETDA